MRNLSKGIKMPNSVLKVTPSLLIGLSEFAFLIRPSVVNSSIVASYSLFKLLVVILNALIIVPLVLYALVKIKSIAKFDILFLIVFNCLFFLLTLWINPSYDRLYFDSHTFNGGSMDIYSKIFNLYSSAFVGYVLVRVDGDNEHFCNVLVLSCRVKFFISFWQFSLQEDYMSFGYEMAMIAIILLASYFVQRKKVDLVFSVLSIIEAVLFGSRGSIWGFFVYFVFVSFVIEKKVITWKKTVLILTVIISYIFLSSNSFVMWLLAKLDAKNLFSRSLQIFISGDYAIDSARSNIWQKCISAIRNHNIFYGYGAYGDRAVLWNGNYYAHNIILEVILTFGLFFGIIFIGIFIYYLLCAYKKSDLPNRLFISACACYALCRLFISSSFWYEKILFILIALCINKAKQRNMHKISG